MAFFFAFLMFIALIAILAVIVYNRIIKLKVQVNEGWSDIQVQLKRRHNLIGNLVETVKGYATHEQETLEKVIQARNAAQQAEGAHPGDVQSAERNLTNALAGLKINALAEAYPDLKANTNFLELQRELSDTENKIAASRRFYNTTVAAFNTYIKQIPGMLFAGVAKASPAQFFEADEDAKVQEVPNVNFHAKPEEKAEVKAAEPAAAETPGPAKTNQPDAPQPTEAPAPTPAPTPETPAPAATPAPTEPAPEAPTPAAETPPTEEKKDA